MDILNHKRIVCFTVAMAMVLTQVVPASWSDVVLQKVTEEDQREISLEKVMQEPVERAIEIKDPTARFFESSFSDDHGALTSTENETLEAKEDSETFDKGGPDEWVKEDPVADEAIDSPLILDSFIAIEKKDLYDQLKKVSEKEAIGKVLKKLSEEWGRDDIKAEDLFDFKLDENNVSFKFEDKEYQTRFEFYDRIYVKDAETGEIYETMGFIMGDFETHEISKSEDEKNTEFVIGDLNGDGRYTGGDTVLLRRHLEAVRTGEHPEWLLDAKQQLAGDIDGDGKLTETDVYLHRAVVVGTLTASDFPIMFGDLSGDGRYTGGDTVLIQRHLLAVSTGEHPEWILKSKQYLIADLDQDGKVTNFDMLLLQRINIGLVNPADLPIVFGDANGDGERTEEDVNVLLNHLEALKKGEESPLSEFQQIFSDLDRDQKITDFDVRLMRALIDGTIKVEDFPISVGDLNGDSTWNSPDTTLLRRHMEALKKGEESPLSPLQQFLGDLDGDNAITFADVQLMRGLIGQIITPADFPLKFGDVNGNGSWNAPDTGLMLRHIEALKRGEASPLSPLQQLLGDLDGDGAITFEDFRVGQRLIGLITKLEDLPLAFGDLSLSLNPGDYSSGDGQNITLSIDTETNTAKLKYGLSEFEGHYDKNSAQAVFPAVYGAKWTLILAHTQSQPFIEKILKETEAGIETSDYALFGSQGLLVAQYYKSASGMPDMNTTYKYTDLVAGKYRIAEIKGDHFRLNRAGVKIEEHSHNYYRYSEDGERVGDNMVRSYQSGDRPLTYSAYQIKYSKEIVSTTEIKATLENIFDIFESDSGDARFENLATERREEKYNIVNGRRESVAQVTSYFLKDISNKWIDRGIYERENDLFTIPDGHEGRVVMTRGQNTPIDDKTAYVYYGGFYDGPSSLGVGTEYHGYGLVIRIESVSYLVENFPAETRFRWNEKNYQINLDEQGNVTFVESDDSTDSVVSVADIDGDGTISAQEAVAGLSAFGGTFWKSEGDDGYNAAYDFNGDNVVNQFDLGLLVPVLNATEESRLIRDMYMMIASEDLIISAEEAIQGLAAFGRTFGRSLGEEGFNASHDYDGSGTVNLGDLAFINLVASAFDESGIRALAAYHAIDADGDLVLSEEEVVHAYVDITRMAIGSMDADLTRDLDGDGYISGADVTLLHELIGVVNERASQAIAAFIVADTDGDGEISMEEGVRAISRVSRMAVGLEPVDIRYDVTGNGEVSSLDTSVFSAMVLAMNKRAFQGFKALQLADTDGDGEISMEEGVRAMSRVSRMAVGLEPVDIRYDVTGNGEVSSLDTSVFSAMVLAMNERAWQGFKAFRNLDTNQDGSVDATEAYPVLIEISKGLGKQAGDEGWEALAKYDLDGNGALTLTDLGTHQNAFEALASDTERQRLLALKTLDTNEDGKIDKLEAMKAIVGYHQNYLKAGVDNPFNFNGDGGVNIQDFGFISFVLEAAGAEGVTESVTAANNAFLLMDTNGDKEISIEELDSAVEGFIDTFGSSKGEDHFNQAYDVNNDGVVDVKDFDAFNLTLEAMGGEALKLEDIQAPKQSEVRTTLVEMPFGKNQVIIEKIKGSDGSERFEAKIVSSTGEVIKAFQIASYQEPRVMKNYWYSYSSLQMKSTDGQDIYLWNFDMPRYNYSYSYFSSRDPKTGRWSYQRL
jgi:Ca2+-binding EF-hand superfamily protein